MAGCRLYLVTPPVLAPASFRDTLAEALDAGDVAAVQLRLKDLDDDSLRRAIDTLRPVVQDRGVAFLLNDRPDLAVAHGCDGAHVGQSDTPAAVARKILGDLTLGVTCHNSRDLAMSAGEEGADYVAFGAFFPLAMNVAAGARQTPRTLIRAAMMLGTPPRKLLWRVVLPATLPSVFAGLRIGLGLAWVLVIVIGVANAPTSWIQMVPVISPLPLSE